MLQQNPPEAFSSPLKQFVQKQESLKTISVGYSSNGPNAPKNGDSEADQLPNDVHVTTHDDLSKLSSTFEVASEGQVEIQNKKHQSFIDNRKDSFASDFD